MPSRDLSRWTQNEDGSWRMTPRKEEVDAIPYLEDESHLAGGPQDAHAEQLIKDYSEMKLPELRDELVSRGLSKYGNKPELIERLREADALA